MARAGASQAAGVFGTAAFQMLPSSPLFSSAPAGRCFSTASQNAR